MGVESSPNKSLEQTKEWYVLVGIKDKVLEAAYVKEQFHLKKIKIRGAYSKEEIVNYYHNGMISYDTILFKEGDSEWRPFHRQHLSSTSPLSTKITEKFNLTGEKSDKFTSFADRIISHADAKRKILLAFSAATIMAYFVYSYYYYKPEQIYDRIKQGVVLITTESSTGQTTSLGSGFVIGNVGVIATNLHVISRSATVRIKSGAGLSYDAEGVLYIDNLNDMALLKISKKDKNEVINGIQIGNPGGVKIGERVYAVGNPAGMEFSLSEGIVSGKRSEDPISKEARDLIQITAPLSPGNSGGPVLNKKGEVVAVATLASKNELQNLNFAVPVNVLGDLQKYKDMEYKFLPSCPKWTPVQANLNYGSESEGSPDATVHDIVSTYYNKETITVRGDKIRAWVRTQIASPSITYDSYGRQSIQSRNREIIGLVEISCKKNIFRFNILTGQADDEDPSSTSNFSGNNTWKPVDNKDKQLFEDVCKNQ